VVSIGSCFAKDGRHVFAEGTWDFHHRTNNATAVREIGSRGALRAQFLIFLHLHFLSSTGSMEGDGCCVLACLFCGGIDNRDIHKNVLFLEGAVPPGELVEAEVRTTIACALELSTGFHTDLEIHLAQA
jgi:hypothetical protein